MERWKYSKSLSVKEQVKYSANYSIGVLYSSILVQYIGRHDLPIAILHREGYSTKTQTLSEEQKISECKAVKANHHKNIQ